MQSFFSTLQEITPNAWQNVLMSEHTSFKIGGKADFLVIPRTEEEVVEVLKLCKDLGVGIFVMGNGSNLLVGDKGIRGVVIKISKTLAKIDIDGNKITAGAGVLLSSLSKSAAKMGLSGLEFASGIPGALGGAIKMNAGAYGQEMKDVVVNVEYIDFEGQKHVIDNEHLNFGYRNSFFSDRDDLLITKVELSLSFKEQAKIFEMMEDLNNRRREKQPLNLPSAGSAFKRPKNGYASALIEEAGLKGYSIGGAQVSQKHAGFIINKGGATADDVLMLLEYIKKRIKELYGETLEAEIKLYGE